MGKLGTQIDADFKTAMKERDKTRVGAVRLIRAALQNKAIDKRGELDDDEEIAVLVSMAKQRKDSIEQFTKGGRQDLVDQETAELAIIEAYLPAQMSAEEVAAEVKAAIAATGAAGPKDMGKVMGALMGKLKGKADGKLVNELVRKLLAQ